MIWGSGGSKSRLAKAAGAEPSGQMRDEKMHAVVARSTFWSQNVQNTTCSDHFWKLRCLKSARRCGAKHMSKSKGGRSTRDTWVRYVRRSGRWFPGRGCILEHQIVRFAKMILRDRCSPSYDLASLFRGRRNTLDRWNGKIAKRIGTRPQLCIQLSIFEGRLAELLCFWCCQLRKWRNSRRLVSFLTLSSSKIEISQNCCVFDVVQFKNWGSLAE